MKRLVVIGNPVSHSLSPSMFNAAFKKLGMDNEFVYDKLQLETEELEGFVKKIREGEIFGANVTIPHKVNIIPFLDKLTKEAELIGAINIIYKEGDEIIGHNADGLGCLNALKDKNVEVTDKKILLLGAGGASRAISFIFALNNAKEIVLLDINEKGAEKLAKEVQEKTGISTKSGNINKINEYIPKAEIIINCSPMGMKGKFEDQTLATAEQLNSELIVMDIVYTPQRTKLLIEAEKAGCKTIEGIGMFVHQGVIGFKIFTGSDAPAQIMKNAVLEALNA